ncbi:unnamed protein product, partial [marine sediment metagenome]
MGMTDAERDELSEVLGRCDDSLADKPILSKVYDLDWRCGFRKDSMACSSLADVEYPAAYAACHFSLLPVDYQQRVEEGVGIILRKLCARESAHFIERLRERGCASAEEEALLARGFALVFGEDAIQPPQGSPNDRRPEFSVRIGQVEIDVEAKGLFDSDLVRRLSKTARRQGKCSWATGDRRVNAVHRVRSSVAKKLLKTSLGRRTMLVLRTYSLWPSADKTVDLLRKMTLNPAAYEIPWQY